MILLVLTNQANGSEPSALPSSGDIPNRLDTGEVGLGSQLLDDRNVEVIWSTFPEKEFDRIQ